MTSAHERSRLAFERLAVFPSHVLPSSQDGPDHAEGLTQHERVVIEAALKDLRAFDEEDRSRILLMKDFFNLDLGQAPPEGRIDATGRARLLSVGPHIFLPAGAWKARSVHQFSAELAGVPFTIDAVFWGGSTAHELARTSFTIPATGGVVEILLNFTVTHPHAIIEMRLHADRAIFAGDITLGYVELVRAQQRDTVLGTIGPPL